jgi:hypothetical protein
MKTCKSVLVPLCLCVLLFVTRTRAQETGSVVGWGSRVVVQEQDLNGLVALAAGDSHSLGLKEDGTVVAWGTNADGQCTVPAPNADFTLRLRRVLQVTAWA